MEFTIGRDEFLKALAKVQGIVSSRGPMPILANVLLEAGENNVSVFATNLDMGLRGVFPAKVAARGSVTAQAKKLHDIVRELPSAPIQVKTDDDGRCRVSCGKSRFNLATIDAAEFPGFPSFDRGAMINIDAEMLSDMIRRTSYAVSQDETRITLNGALFEVAKTRVRMVATDGHRLAFVEREGAFGVKDQVKAIIARKAIAELGKLLSEGGEEEAGLRFLLQDNHIVFERGAQTLAIRLIEGAYPNYEQVIPKSFERKAEVEVAEFVHSLRRVATLADEKSHMTRLSFSQGRLELASEGGEIGEAKDEIAAEYEGEEMTVGLNALYLLELLNSIGGDKVAIKMIDQLSPVLVQPPSDNSLLCIVMPMRL